MSDTGSVSPARPDLRLQAVELLIGNFEGDVRAARFDFGDAAGRIGHEFEHHGFECRLRTPILRMRLEPQECVALEGVNLVRAGSDRRLLKTFGADLLEIGFRQHIAGEERHPLEQRRLEFQHIAGNGVAVDLVVADFRPDELDRIAAFRVGRARQRPDHVFRRHRRAVVPDRILANLHRHFRLIRVPAPFGQKTRLERQIRRLADIGVEDRLVDRLDGRIDRGHADRRIERRQIDIVGDGQGPGGGLGRGTEQTGGERQACRTGQLKQRASRQNGGHHGNYSINEDGTRSGRR